ncbi:MAG TPA: hypothetical protein VF550_10490 [Polyangia bacterium]
MGAAIRRNLAFVVFLTIGCGGLGAPPKMRDAGAPFGTGVVADFENAYLPALCQYDVTCHVTASVDGCRADLSAYWQRSIRKLQSELESGRAVYDADKASSCVDAIQSAPCPSASNSWKPFAWGCQGVFQGAVVTGQSCFSDLECASGHCKWSLSDAYNCTISCCPGACAPLVDVGANCFTDDYSSDCVDTAYCKGPAYVSNGTCQARLDQGETCGVSAEDPCQNGLTCGESNTCVPFPKDGQPCTYSGPPCDNYDSYCDLTKGTCQARLKVGAPCAHSGDSGCVRYAQCLNGFCTLLPGAGEACAIPDGGYDYSSCRWGVTRCTDGICQEPTVAPLCTVASVPMQDAGAMPPDAPVGPTLDADVVATDTRPCLAHSDCGADQ